MPMKVREMLQLLRQNGWTVVRQRGSHLQLKHSQKTDLITIAGNENAEFRPGTLNDILKKAGLK